MKHTQGEWSLPHFADPTCKCDCRWILSEGCCGSIATINVDNGKRIIDGGNDSPPLEEAIANARLIHAAPELLTLVELMATLDDIWPSHRAMSDRARRLIARIEGKAPDET